MRRTDIRKPLIVFAKAPRPGAVKTRLIPVLGAQGAAAHHARLIKHTLAAASVACRDALELHADVVDDDFLRYCAARYNARLVAQRGDDLGERMHHAFETALVTERCPSAVLIGSDCPALTAAHLRRAFTALAGDHEAVIAPAEDGGYVLIGLCRIDALLFSDVPWGTDVVLHQTRERLRGLGWRWQELETLWDVDRPADLVRLEKCGFFAHTARPGARE